MNKIKFIAIILLLVLTAIPADIKLAWDANTDPIAGYKIYQSYGTNQFTNILQVAVSPSPTATITNLNTAGITNRFFVTATNSAGLESDPSNIVTLGPSPFAPSNLTATVVFTIKLP